MRGAAARARHGGRSRNPTVPSPLEPCERRSTRRHAHAPIRVRNGSGDTPLHRRLLESEKPTVSRSPEAPQTVSRLFRRCDFFDWRFFDFGSLAMLIRGVQEPSNEAGAALLHDLRIIGLLLIVKEPVIFRVAHGILHLLSAPTIKQLRTSVYCSRPSGHPRPRSLRGGPSEAQSLADTLVTA